MAGSNGGTADWSVVGPARRTRRRKGGAHRALGSPLRSSGAAAAVDFLSNAPGDVLEQRELVGGPLAPHVVDHAERPKRVAIRGQEGNAGVGDRASVTDRGAVSQERMFASVGHHERCGRCKAVLAVGVRERHLSQRGPA